MNVNSAHKSKPICPPVNKTAEPVADHLAKEATEKKGMTREEINKMFETPAQIISHFQVLTTPTFVRLAFSEKDASGNPHYRAMFAFDYMTLFEFKDMINDTCARIMALGETKPVENPEKKAEDAAITDKETSKVDIEV